jgi:hypothetical protein
MRARAAEVEALERRAILRSSRSTAESKNFDRVGLFAVMNVPAAETVSFFEIAGVITCSRSNQVALRSARKPTTIDHHIRKLLAAVYPNHLLSTCTAANCTWIDITSGDGNAMSRYGSRENSPYFDASKARSR